MLWEAGACTLPLRYQYDLVKFTTAYDALTLSPRIPSSPPPARSKNADIKANINHMGPRTRVTDTGKSQT